MTDSLSRALSAAAVQNAKPKERPYKLADGGGLFLQVQPSGAKLWRYKFRLHGKEGLLAIGVYPEVTLKQAREAHNEARAQVAAGINPVADRKAKRADEARQALQADKGLLGSVLAEWKTVREKELSPASIRQQARELAKYVEPKFANERIDRITRLELTELVKSISKTAPEVARNVRTYLDNLFEFAIDSGLVVANPVPPPRILGKRGAQRHHDMLAESALPGFLVALDASRINPSTRGAMLLLVLTACRKTEVVGARWDEFNLDAAEWVIPANRMKSRREHVVPLSTQAVAILAELHKYKTAGELVFPHRSRSGETMADRTLNATIERLGYGELATPHGFRAAFSTHWNAREANPDVIEKCLAHAHRDKVRAAYNRNQYLAERRVLLQEWADFIDQQRAKGQQAQAEKLKEAA